MHGETMIYDENDASDSTGAARQILDERIRRFADRLKTMIGDQSVRSFARKCGLSEKSLRKYLAGNTDPSGSAIIAMAEAGGVNILWLMTGEGPMRREETEQSALKSPEPAPAVDADTLTTVIKEVEIAMQKRRLHLSADKQARLIGVLYDYVKKTGDTKPVIAERYLDLMT
jgi:transcriptional regulator with XRE-family HTH domain